MRGAERCELFRSLIAETAAGANRVVIAALGFDLSPRVERVAEPARKQAYLQAVAISSSSLYPTHGAEAVETACRSLHSGSPELPDRT